MNTKNLTACTILIVEDDPLIREGLVRLLAKLGYSTIAVETVAEALTKLDGATYVILDLNLPDGIGTTVLARIRAEHRPIRVAISSGTTEQTVLEEARKHQPDAMLEKPIKIPALLEWLNYAG